MRTLLIIAITLLTCVTARAQTCPAPHIQAHLATVEAELRGADVSHLTPPQLARRQHHLAVLADYRAQCRFPQNLDYPDRLVTLFVDSAGTHCAVGYLMAMDGQTALVERIRATANTATIWELAGDREVQRWLVDNGLSLYEAARIQPSYCMQTRAGSCLCGTSGFGGSTYYAVTGIAEGTITSVFEDEGAVEVAIESVVGSGAAMGETKRSGRVPGDTVGRHVMLVIHGNEGDARTVYSRGADRHDDAVECTTQGTGYDGAYCATVPYDVYVEALFSEDCMARVIAEDAVLGESTCNLDGLACMAAENSVTSGGCGVGSLAHLVTLGLLVVSRVRRRSGTGPRART